MLLPVPFLLLCLLGGIESKALLTSSTFDRAIFESGYGVTYRHNFIHHLMHVPGKVERSGIHLDDLAAPACPEAAWEVSQPHQTATRPLGDP